MILLDQYDGELDETLRKFMGLLPVRTFGDPVGRDRLPDGALRDPQSDVTATRRLPARRAIREKAAGEKPGRAIRIRHVRACTHHRRILRSS